MNPNKNQLRRCYLLDECFSDFTKAYDFKRCLDYVQEKIDQREFQLYGEARTTISESTLRRDIKFMKEELEVPLREDLWDTIEGRTGSKQVNHKYKILRYSSPDYSIRRMNNDERSALVSLFTSMARYRSQAFFKELFKPLEDFAYKLNIDLESLEGEEILMVDETRSSFTGQSHIPEFINHIKEKNVISFHYKPYDGQMYKVTVHPFAVKESLGNWYLFCRNNKYVNEEISLNNLKVIPLDRVINETIGVEKSLAYDKHMLSPDFKPNEFLNNILGIPTPGFLDKTEIIFETGRALGNMLENYPLHFSQITLSQNPYRFRLNLIPSSDLFTIFLSYGEDLEILEPTFFRKLIKRKLKVSLKHYE